MIADPYLDIFANAIASMRLSPLSLSSPNGNRDERLLLIQEHVRARANVASARQPTVSNGSIPDIGFYFIDHPALNALAFEAGGRAYIGVYTGAVLLTRDLFFRMLSHPEILPDIGDASAERVEAWHSEGLTDNYQKLLDRRRPGTTLLDVAPRDPTRRQFANHLAQIALDFIVFHEFGHIRSGHCRDTNSITKTNLISEIVLSASSQKFDPSEPLTSQVIELEADTVAANITFMLQTTDAYNQPFDHFDSHVSDWCFAIMSLFWMWGFAADVATVGQSPYPPPAYRFHGALTLAREMGADSVGKEFEDRFQKIGNTAFRLARDAVKKISGGVDDATMIRFYADAKEDVLVHHWARILEHWKGIRGELVKYSYVQEYRAPTSSANY